MGLLDREYMQNRFGGGSGGWFRRPAWRWTVLRGLLAANLAGFLILEIAARASDHFEVGVFEWFALSASAIATGKLWTLATSSLLHKSFWHLAANMLVLWAAGRALERLRGGRFLLVSYIGGVLASGLLWVAFVALFGAIPVNNIGASGGVFAVLTALLLAWPRERVEFYLLFIPVAPRRAVLLGVLGGLTAAGLVLAEVPDLTHWWPVLWQDDTSHLSHLGGMFFAAAAWWRAHNLERFPALRFRRRRVRPLRQVATFFPPKNSDSAPGTAAPNSTAAPAAGTRAAAGGNIVRFGAPLPSATEPVPIPPPPSRQNNAAANAETRAGATPENPSANAAPAATDAAAARFSAIASDGRAARRPPPPAFAAAAPDTAHKDAGLPTQDADSRDPGRKDAGRLEARPAPRPNAAIPASRPAKRIGNEALTSPRRQPESPLMREVNRILDKINTSGIASLTQAERDMLERASQQLRR